MISIMREECAQLLATIPKGGASLSVWRRGEECFTLCRGDGWSTDTLVPVFSATKLLSAACVLHALEESGYDRTLEIGELWPRFPAPRGTVAQLLSHQLGLAALARPSDIFDLDECRAAIEESQPLWSPPSLGYHPHTLGPILDILMLELRGERLCTYWDRKIRAPKQLDVYLGNFSEELYPRIRTLRPPRLQDRPDLTQDTFYRDYMQSGTLTHAAFHSIQGIGSIREMNDARAWHCGDPAKGAVASAAGLARFYQLLLAAGEESPFSKNVLRSLSEVQVRGMDRVLQQEMSYSCGALIEKHGVIPAGGFGHAGAGGSHACSQPASGLSFAFVMDQMEWGILPSDRTRAMLNAVFSEI